MLNKSLLILVILYIGIKFFFTLKKILYYSYSTQHDVIMYVRHKVSNHKASYCDVTYHDILSDRSLYATTLHYISNCKASCVVSNDKSYNNP